MAVDGTSNVEGQYIRGLDIDKTVKGFALIDYIFKKECSVSSTTGDSIRWYQETAADPTATAPAYIQNISPLSVFPIVQVSWTRNVSYVRKYAAEGYISMEDMASADIDVLARTLLRLTRAVVKQVDTRIWQVLSEANSSGTPSPVLINTFNTSGAWTAGVGSDPIKDIMFAKEHLTSGGYQAEGSTLFMDAISYRALMDWLIWTKGSNIPQMASDMVRNGTVLSILGVNIKVSVNASADYALLCIPQQSCTWKTFTDTTARVIDDPGLGSKIRVFELGEAILTDPKSVVLISNTV